jgi:hypothetical protein
MAKRWVAKIFVNGIAQEKLQFGAAKRGLRAAGCSDEAAERRGVGKDKV